MGFLEDHLGAGRWRADPPFSSVTFKVRHLGARDYRAGFRETDATLDAAAGTLSANVPVASLDVGNPVIRERMLSPEFLAAARCVQVRAMRRPATAIVALVIAVLAAGCGADEERSAGPGAGSTQTVTAPGATQTAAAPGDTQTSTARQLPPAAAADLPRGGRTAQRAVPAMRDCLSRQGYRASGGAAQPDDADAPDYQILVSGTRGSAFVAFYDTLARARRFERKVRRNAKKVKNTSVERHGTITVVWVSLTDRAARARIRDCIVQES